LQEVTVAADSIPAQTPLLNATPWRGTLEPPRGPKKSIYMRCRRTVAGKREEHRESLGTLDEAEARRLMDGWLARANGTATATDPTVLEVVHARIKALELDQAEPNTLKKYQSVARMLATLPFASVRASELVRRHLIEARDAIKAGAGGNGPRSNQTTNAAMIFVGSCWRWALDREMVKAPWPTLEALDTSKPARPKRAYTPAEVSAVLNYVRARDPRWYPIFALLAATGARVQDVLDLRSSDVLHDAGVIVLRDPKTHQPLEVGVPAEVLAVLPEREPGAYLFPSRVGKRGGKPMTQDGARECLRRALSALAIPDADWLDVHSFRRSFCADAEEAGVPAHQARKQTGHSAEMFAHYAGKARGKVREVAERVHAHRAALSPALSTEGTTAEHNSSGANAQAPSRYISGIGDVMGASMPGEPACVQAGGDNGHGRSRSLAASHGALGDEALAELVAKITARVVASVLTDPDVRALLAPQVRVLPRAAK
jgi:integrase